ncbi:MAG: MFS transporter [Actinomycetota bacterium]
MSRTAPEAGIDDVAATARDGVAVSTRSPRAILWAVGFSVFVAADDLTVVSTMLRPIVADLGLVMPDGLDDAAWIVNAYLIAFIAVMPLAGRLSDVIGRRRTFLVSWLIFLVGTIWIPLADSLETLLAGRVLTAIGGGAMVPVALAVVGDVFPPDARARALGSLGAIETLGWVWGPLYGAMLVRFLSWEWQFWLNVPLAIAGAAVVWWALAEHDRPPTRVRIDWVGAGLLTTALVSLNLALLGSAEVQSVEGLDQLTGNGGTDLRALYPVAFAAAIAFVWHQRRLRVSGRDALIDTRLFRGRNVKVALVVNFLVGAALVIAMVDVPLFVNAVELDLERSAVVAGWILSALTATMAVASYLGGRYTERTWYGPPIIVGLAAATVAYTLMGFTWAGDTPYPLLALQLGLLGAGIGLTIAPTTSAVVDHAEPDARGAAAGIVMVVRMVGLSVGLSALTAWGLARFNARRGDIELPPITDPGFTDAVSAATEELTSQSIADTFVMSAIALAAGLVIALVAVRRPRPPAPTSESPGDHDRADQLLLGQHAEAVDPPVHPLGTSAAADPDAAVGRIASPTSTHQEAPMSTDESTTEYDEHREHEEHAEHEEHGEHEAGSASDAAATPAPTDEMPVLALRADEEIEALDPADSVGPVGVEPSWVQRNLTAVVGVFGLLLLGTIGLLAMALLQLSSTRSDLDTMRAELATAREDVNRVEAGAAIYASQINGFVETVNDLGPSIDDGLDQAIVGLDEFASSTIEFTVNIDENISIEQDFAIQRTVEVPIDTTVPINTEFDTTISVNGPFGIDIPIDITVPVDVDVPISLTAEIPIDETIPIDVDVPVALDVPIKVDVEGTELQSLATSLIDGLRAFQAGLGGLTAN